MPEKVRFIKGDLFTDQRGTLQFVNEFSFPDVKRFYQITHPDVTVVRAWQGHKIEQKFFYVVKGKFALAWVAIDDWDHPSPDLTAEHVVLEEGIPAVLHIPPGFANGMKALEPDSVIMVYSNLDLQASAADRWSFDQRLWFDWQKLASNSNHIIA
jgi:dTDP-4-dehydrorhamnose 3,5-epimerase